MNGLLQVAEQARERAYAPYSKFSVGAAVQTADGRIFTGCNVENASYGLTVCAERVAIFNAITAGATDLRELAVVADTSDPVAPCGACRQVMLEFGIRTVHMGNLQGRVLSLQLAELLPHAFVLNK